MERPTKGHLGDLSGVSARFIGRATSIGIASGPYRSATVRTPNPSTRPEGLGWGNPSGMTPDESHAASTPTNGQVARVGEGDVARKRLLPSLENLRRPVPF